MADISITASPSQNHFLRLDRSTVTQATDVRVFDDHDGRGVNDDALQDAVEHPMSPPSYQINEQGKGAYLYQGKDASVVLNKVAKW